MNTTLGVLVSSTESVILGISSDLITQILLATVGILSIGVALNSLLIIGLVLMRRSGKISRPSLQMLLQQSTVDLLCCAIVIAISFDSMNWPAVGTAPAWLIGVICYLWHSQVGFYILYGLCVNNNVLIAGERLVAIAFPFRAAQLARVRYRVAIFIVNVATLTGVMYDPVYSCVTVDLSAPQNVVVRWYSLFWAIINFLVPLMCSVALNSAAVIKLRSENRQSTKTTIISGSNKTGAGAGGTLLKDKAAIRLQRASIALAASLAITSAPLQIISEIQIITGNYWGLSDIRNIMGNCISALHFTIDPLLCFVFLPGIRRALIPCLATLKSK